MRKNRREGNWKRLKSVDGQKRKKKRDFMKNKEEKKKKRSG